MATPNYAQVKSLTQWDAFFNPTDGLFRLPSTRGADVEHLDIDLRFVGDSDGLGGEPLHLPHVCILTLRGSEYVQEDDVRMDALAEVLLAVNPVEVRWLNAEQDPAEQLSFATHLVHPAVIKAGENWSAAGTLRKLVVQGGFPCPNLTAPTPFSLTPAATPCPSPGSTRTTFGLTELKGGFASGLPALSTQKPKPIDEERLKAREERKRQADYMLKPRFGYAFGSWSVEELQWRLDGRYTPACVVTVVTHFLKALNSSFPSATRAFDNDLPSVLSFTSLPASIVSQLQSLPERLGLDAEIRGWLADVVFVSLGDERHARLWDAAGDERVNRRIKAEMLLLKNHATIVALEDLSVAHTLRVPTTRTADLSPAESFASLLPAGTETSTEDEGEAITPPAGDSPVMRPVDQVSKKSARTLYGERSMSSSMVI
nr:hypothetical protein L204_03006 [Cryptococcus depauperatus CBS 7855]